MELSRPRESLSRDPPGNTPLHRPPAAALVESVLLHAHELRHLVQPARPGAKQCGQPLATVARPARGVAFNPLNPLRRHQGGDAMVLFAILVNVAVRAFRERLLTYTHRCPSPPHACQAGDWPIQTVRVYVGSK